MGAELLILIGSIVGGTGAMLSFWAGWRARDQQDQPRYRRGNSGTTCGGGEVTRAEWEAMRTRRIVDPYGATIGYMPIQSRSGANPPPREP